MKRKGGTYAGLLAGLVIGILLSPVIAGPKTPKQDKLVTEFFQPLARMMAVIRAKYVEEIDHKKLLVGAYQGVLSQLDDYSSYMTADHFAEFQSDTKGQFGGLGIQIKFLPVEKVVRIEQPIPGTPAFRAGLMQGDRIYKVREESSGKVTETKEFHTVYDAVKTLRGTPGTRVTISVIHADSRPPEEVTITRAIIKVPAVRAVHMLDEQKKIGYIYVAHFHERALADLEKALEELKKQGMKALVLDLRFNPGGLLHSAVQLSDKFLSGGAIVSTRARNGAEQIYHAEKNDDFADLPLVVLVNKRSASASEIVAGALKDHGRAIVIGEKTFGKGSVQSVLPLRQNEGAVKLTTARYYTPGGVCIEKVGIMPDVEIPLTDKETLELSLNLNKLTAFPPPLEEGKSEPAPESPKPKESPETKTREGKQKEPGKEFVDVQLERATDVLRGVLMERQLKAQNANKKAA